MDGVRAAAPDAVIEIRSPGDDTDEKLPFYAAIGTREVVIIDRDTKSLELYRFENGTLRRVSPDADGWHVAEPMNVRFRRIDARPPRIRIEDALDSSLCVEI